MLKTIFFHDFFNDLNMRNFMIGVLIVFHFWFVYDWIYDETYDFWTAWAREGPALGIIKKCLKIFKTINKIFFSFKEKITKLSIKI